VFTPIHFERDLIDSGNHPFGPYSGAHPPLERTNPREHAGGHGQKERQDRRVALFRKREKLSRRVHRGLEQGYKYDWLDADDIQWLSDVVMARRTCPPQSRPEEAAAGRPGPGFPLSQRSPLAFDGRDIGYPSRTTSKRSDGTLSTICRPLIL